MAHKLASSWSADCFCSLFSRYVRFYHCTVAKFRFMYDCTPSIHHHSHRSPLPLPTPTTNLPSPAAGLYYLAEVIEEYSVLARKIITYTLIVSSCAQLLNCINNNNLLRPMLPLPPTPAGDSCVHRPVAGGWVSGDPGASRDTHPCLLRLPPLHLPCHLPPLARIHRRNLYAH